MQKKVKLNLGCGLQCPEGWINIDSSIGAKLSKFPVISKLLHAIIPKSWGVLPNVKWPSNVKWMDITKKFPFDSNSADCIYSSHTFEHLTYAEASFVLNECNRVIRHGGVIRIIVPDLNEHIESYIRNRRQMPDTAAQKLLQDFLYFEIPVPKTFGQLLKYHFKKKNNHHFLYDQAGLAHQLKQAGFDQIESKQYGESRIDNIVEIDNPSRFEGAICLEAIKIQ